jgi:hypothetical protein
MTTTLYKIGGRFYSLDAVFRIDPAFDPTLYDKRHPPGLGVEITFNDLKAVVYFDQEAEALRRFLAGDLSETRHYGIGIRAEVIDFTPPEDIGSERPSGPGTSV